MTRPRSILLLCVVSALVLVPLATVSEGVPHVAPADSAPFLWDSAELWTALQARFEAARTSDCAGAEAAIQHFASDTAALPTDAGPGHVALVALEDITFEAAALTAACPQHAALFLATADEARRRVKELSRSWTLDKEARDQLYRLLYGSRLAVEEVAVRRTGDPVAFDRLEEIPSQAPSVVVAGVRVHSGDLLVSRGGAPTSALIARGNDRPGNFSHVALAHVDATTGQASVIEAHIESGVGVFSADTYLSDKKLRVLVLRLRPDDPAVLADPLIAHKAAEAARAAALDHHIPYDFGMDSADATKQFCSEVPFQAYRALGVDLWPGPTTVSDPGMMSLFAAFGVRTSSLLAPSDLEYGPRLVAAAEWRDTDALRQDRLDNAVLDAILGRVASDGLPEVRTRMLLAARGAKAWSWLLNRLGRVGPVPEGMSASRALRAQALDARHAAVRARLEELVAEREAADGYAAPYWTLVKLAERAAAETAG